MAEASMQVTIADLPEIRSTLFAAIELLQEVEQADPALVTDEILARAADLRRALQQW